MSKRSPGAAQQPFIFQTAALLGLLILAVYLVGSARRADPTTGQERYDQLAGALDDSHVLEQTFIAGRDNLCAINVFAMVPPGRLNPGRTLTLRLRDLDTGRDLGVGQFTLQSIQANPRILLTFPTQPHSKGKRYALRVETNAPADTVSLFASRDDAYFDGALSQNGTPLDRDLTFRAFTALEPAALLGELAQRAPEYGLLLGVTLFLGLVGAALLALTGRWPETSWSGRGLWAVGAGTALVPLMFFVFGRQIWYGLGALAVTAALRVGWQALKRGKAGLAPLSLPRLMWSDAVLPALFLWALAVRLLQAVDVAAPMWVDGTSHVQMVQAIAEAGRIPAGLLYHVGFHTLVVLLGDLTHLPAPTTIVLVGQWVSALNGPALYVLARRLYPQNNNEEPRVYAPRLAAPPPDAPPLFAALILATLPSLPGYLMNWGRYPFLFGLTLLPLTLAATLDAARAIPSKRNLAVYILPLVLLGGQLLSHYGTLSFWLSFSLVCLAFVRPAWLNGLRDRRVKMKAGMALIALLAFGLLVGFARFGDNLVEKMAEIIAQSRQAGQDLDYGEIWQLNLRSGGVWLLALGLLGLARAAFQRRWAVLALSAGWFAAQSALIALQSPLLGYAIASYANLLLALPLPLSLLAGDFLYSILLPADQPRRHTAGRAAAVLVLALFALAGGLSQIGILNPTTLLYSPDDARAMDWIKANTAPDGRFLINAAVWGENVTPLDGGSWITPMTGRAAVPISSRDQAEYLAGLAKRENLQYIYLGRSTGFLQRSVLRSSPDMFQPLYRQGGVEIYAIHP